MNKLKDQIKYDDFAKLDLRTGEITEVYDIEGADKLYKILVNVGFDEPIQILSGIKEYFTKEDLTGKTIIVLVNLEPRKMRGEISNGMLLAVDGEGGVNLLAPEKDSRPGELVR